MLHCANIQVTHYTHYTHCTHYSHYTAPLPKPQAHYEEKMNDEGFVAGLKAELTEQRAHFSRSQPVIVPVVIPDPAYSIKPVSSYMVFSCGNSIFATGAEVTKPGGEETGEVAFTFGGRRIPESGKWFVVARRPNGSFEMLSLDVNHPHGGIQATGRFNVEYSKEHCGALLRAAQTAFPMLLFHKFGPDDGGNGKLEKADAQSSGEQSNRKRRRETNKYDTTSLPCNVYPNFSHQFPTLLVQTHCMIQGTDGRH
jgi:hypothetical protein